MVCEKGRFNTGNDLCSNDLRDLNDNSIIVDGYVNSEEHLIEDRLGTERLTLAGIEASVEDRIGGIIQQADGIEVVGQWGDSEYKTLSQRFVSNNSSRIKNTHGSIGIEDIQNTTGNVAVVNNEVVENRELSNVYINGTLKHDGYSFVPMLSENMLTNQARVNYFGGQLASLKKDLSSPLTQKMVVKFIGDSNTWGMGTGQNSSTTPRNHKMSDARDHFASNGFVNLFKRFIGQKYFNGEPPALSNHPESPTGQSIASYSKYVVMFPYEGQGFKLLKGGHTSPPTFVERVGTITNYRAELRYTDRYNDQHSIEFDFTGESLDIYYTSYRTVQDLKVEVGSKVFYVNGYQADGTTMQNKKTITFPYEKNVKIRLSATNRQSPETSSIFYLEGLGVNKVVEIHNNGIIGQSSASYFNSLVDVALSDNDLYCFIQFGGNDRSIGSARGARSISTLSHYLTSLCVFADNKKIKPVLITTSNGVSREDEIFSRQDAANATTEVGFRSKVDTVDNHSVLNGTNFDVYTSDKTHLNIYGAAVIARNLVNSLESSS